MFLLLANVGLFTCLFFSARWISSRAGKQLQFIIAVISAIACLPSILYSLYYLHFFDDWIFFIEWRSFEIANWYPSLLGWLAGWISVRCKRLILAASCFLIPLVFVCVPFFKQSFLSINPDGLKDRWNGTVCIQTSPTTCGPASIATLLGNAFGDHVTEREAAIGSYTSITGTEIWYIAQFLRARGYRIRFHSGSEKVIHNSIAGTKIGRAGHFVAVIGNGGSVFQIADSLSGDFIEEIQFTGFYMEVQK